MELYNSLYIIWAQVLCQISVMHIFSSSQSLLFHFLNGIFQRAGDFNFDEVQLSIVPLWSVFLAFLTTKYLLLQGTKISSYVLFCKFYSFSFYLQAYDPFQINFCVWREIRVEARVFPK